MNNSVPAVTLRRFDLYHAGFQPVGCPYLAATLVSPETSTPKVLEQIYMATQNVESSWVESKGQLGVTIVPSAGVIEQGGARSTSVGDYVIVHEGARCARWDCEAIGWRKNLK